MRKTADVVIVGGGIIGASVAWHLVQEGCTRVVILEREAEQGLGSTGKATGGVRAQFATEINIRMSMDSIRFFSEFDERVGGRCGYLPYGYLFVAASEAEMATLRQNHDRQHAAGLTNVRMVGRDQIAGMVPQLRVNDLAGGTFCPTDGFIDPPAVMSAWTQAAVGRGVEIELDTAVSGLDHDERGIARVETNQGSIWTRAVVNAAGAWAGQIAGLAGIELPVKPFRRQLVAVHAEMDLSERAPMVLEIAGGFHFRRGPWKSAQTPILMGRPDPQEESGFSTEMNEKETASVIERAQYRLPGLRNFHYDPEHSRAGLYEMTPDHHAIIGEAPELKGFFLANGFSGHGVMHSPATGRIVADLILHGESRHFDITPLRPQRFAEGKLLQETAVL